MKKSNAQAETPSKLTGLLRGSRPFFIFFNRLQAQAHRRGLRALRGSPAQLYFFYFLIDYKHKHTATGVASHVSHVRFFLFF